MQMRAIDNTWKMAPRLWIRFLSEGVIGNSGDTLLCMMGTVAGKQLIIVRPSFMTSSSQSFEAFLQESAVKVRLQL